MGFAIARPNPQTDSLDETALYDVVYYQIRNLLSGTPGVIAPAVYGGKQRRILIYTDKDKLNAHELAPMDVVRAIRRQNVFIPTGTAKIGDYDYQIESNAMVPTVLKSIFDDDPGLLPRQELDIAEAKAKAAGAKITLADAELKAAWQAARQAADMQRYTEIRAPFAGTVSQRFLDPGTLVQSATSSAQDSTRPVLEMVDDSKVRIHIHVPEAEITAVHPGTEAVIRPDAYSGEALRSAVARVAGSIDTSTRTLLAEIELPNVDQRLKSGMFVTVTLRLESHPDALVAPTRAVLANKDKRAVFVVRNGKAKKVAVETGFEGPDWTEIVKGLNGNEAVIVTGKESLKKGEAVQVVAGAEGEGN